MMTQESKRSAMRVITRRRTPPSIPTPSRRRRTPRQLEIVPGTTTSITQYSPSKRTFTPWRTLPRGTLQRRRTPPEPNYSKPLDQENLYITKEIDDYFKIIRLRHPSEQVNTHNDHLDKFIIGIMDIYNADKGLDDKTCSEELIKNFEYYINKEKINPLDKLLYSKGSERGKLKLQDELNTIIKDGKQTEKKIFIRKLFFRLTNEYFKKIFDYQITILNNFHNESWNSEKDIEKNLYDNNYNLRKSDTLFLDAHGKSLDELFTIPKINKIIVYGRYGSTIYSNKIANILGGVSELNKPVFQKKNLLKRSMSKFKSVFTIKKKRESYEEFLFFPEKLKLNFSTENDEDYIRHIYNGHIYNGILKEGTCDMMPNAKLYFSCKASFSYRDKENISNLIYQKQGIFMYGDKDFKREKGSVYAGDLVVQIRDLDDHIKSLIELLLSDETIDITLVGSPIYEVIEKIKNQFSYQTNQFFFVNFEAFILKKKDFYFTHLIGKGLIFEEVKDIENYKQILKNNIQDFMAIHTEFTNEEIYDNIWIKSENLINLMKVGEKRKTQTMIKILKEKKYKKLCIYLIEKSKAGIKLNKFIELIIKFTGSKINNFVPFMCRGFSNGVSDLEDFLKKQCETSHDPSSRVSSFKKTNQKRRLGWKQPKPIISTVDCLNSKHWGIKCGTKFKGYNVEKLKLKLKLIKLNELKNSKKTPSHFESISSILSLTNNSKSFNSLEVGTGDNNNMYPVRIKNLKLEPVSREEVSTQLQKHFLNQGLTIPRNMSTDVELGNNYPQKVTKTTSNAGGAKRTKKKKRKKYKSKKKI